MRVKEESETAGLKLNIQQMKIMAPSSITSQQTDGETMVTVTNFIFGAPKLLWMMTAAMKLKRGLPGRRVMTNLDSVLKTRDINITLPAKVCLVKAMVFPVAMYRCESWTKKWLSTEEGGAGEDS